MGIFNAPRFYPRVYEPYYDQFNFYGDREDWLNSIQSIPEKAVNLFAIHWLHLEVHNGGFSQYFFNSTGTSAPEAVRGFLAIGMPEVATLITSAMNKLGQPYPGSQEARRKVAGLTDGRLDFDDFDRRFYELADTPKFFRKLPKFVAFAEAYADTK